MLAKLAPETTVQSVTLLGDRHAACGRAGLPEDASVPAKPLIVALKSR